MQPTTAARVEGRPQEVAQVPVSEKVSLAVNITKYEKWMLAMAFILMVGIIIGSLMVKQQTVKIQTSMDEMKRQTTELYKQSDFLRNQLTEQYNYQTVKEAAERNGLKLRPDSVKDLTGR